METGVQQVWSPSQFHSFARAPSHVTARNRKPSQRTLGGCPGTSISLRSGIFRAQRKMPAPLAVPIGQERLVGEGEVDHFSCFLLEDDGSSFVGSTAAIATPLKGPAPGIRRGAQREPLL